MKSSISACKRITIQSGHCHFTRLGERTWKMSIGTFAVIACVMHLSVAQDTSTIINTSMGKIRGIFIPYETEYTVQFRNIPYAKPPVGDLRFQKPQPNSPWTGILDGSRFGPSCMQDMTFLEDIVLENRNLSEDCLSLNVYVPRRVPNITDPKKPVMIWVYGGGFTMGQAELYDASALAVKGDVIVVTMNYRLGILGFLSTYDGAAKGNYGLWDQRLAFKWVKDNIASFGGDPNSINIFGESAGGFSVALHSLSPLNKGLFTRVIAQSGVSNSYYALNLRSLYFAKQYAKLLGCTNSTESVITSALVECMRRKSADDILAAQNSPGIVMPIDNYGFIEPLAPVIDGELVMDLPSNSLKDVKSESLTFFRSLDFMTGICNSEGTLGFPALSDISKTMNFNLSLGVPSSVMCGVIINGLVEDLYPDNAFQSFISNAICNEYKSEDNVQQAHKFTDMFGDIFFAAPAAVSLTAHAAENHVTRSYQYMFNRPDLLLMLSMPGWFHGAGHASELSFLFGFDDIKSDYNISTSQVDRQVSETLLSYWTNFAKTGDPNQAGLPVWPIYSNASRKYMNIDSNITAESRMWNDRMNFWIKAVPTIAHL